MKRVASLGIPLLLLGLAATSATGGVLLNPSPGIEWKVSEWINSDPGSLSAHRGRVVFIDFFQLWCPGCNSFSIPLFKEWEEKYSGEDAVFISIHTVFEGHDEQTPERLKAFVAEQGITHPVGIDAYKNPDDEVPITMNRYKTGGTPHVVIIDKEGKIRFSHFGRFDPEPIEAFVERLFSESTVKTKKTLRKGGKGRKNR